MKRTFGERTSNQPLFQVPHFASLRGREREIVILRSDNGETWKEHTLEATEEAVQEVLQESFDEGGNKEAHPALQFVGVGNNHNRISSLMRLLFPRICHSVSERVLHIIHII